MKLLLHLLILGGPLTWILFALAIVTLVFTIERAFHLHRAQLGDVREFLRGIINALRRGNALEAISICDEAPGPVAHVLRAAITRCDRSRVDMEQAVAETCLSEIPRLQRHVKLLLVIAHLAPMLGLLGTVIGMIGLFQTMKVEGSFVDVTTMAGSIWEALISTAAGIGLAIFAYAAYQFFTSRIESILLDMEKASSEIIYFLAEHRLPLENADANNGKSTSP
jgi:biopolymer transport protein ExbB